MQGGLDCYKLLYNKMVTEVAELLQYRLAGQTEIFLKFTKNHFKSPQQASVPLVLFDCVLSECGIVPFCYLSALSLSFLFLSLSEKASFYTCLYLIDFFFPSPLLQQLRFLQHQMAMAAATVQTAQLHQQHTGSQSKSKMKRGTPTTPKF